MKEYRVLRVVQLLLLGFIVVFAGCSDEPDNQSIINIGDQYEIRIHQQLSPAGGLPSLEIKTLEEQDCLNAFISNHLVLSEQKTQIFINDILIEGECISGSEYISEEMLLNSSNASLPIEIILKNAIYNHGTLHSSEYEFDFVLNQNDGLKVSKTRINKIQPNMFWAGFTTNDLEVADQILQYFDSIDLEYSELKGDYGWFYVNQENEITIYERDYDFAFLISTNEALEIIDNKMIEFKQTDSTLVFEATNYDGSSININ